MFLRRGPPSVKTFTFLDYTPNRTRPSHCGIYWTFWHDYDSKCEGRRIKKRVKEFQVFCAFFEFLFLGVEKRSTRLAVSFFRAFWMCGERDTLFRVSSSFDTASVRAAQQTKLITQPTHGDTKGLLIPLVLRP
jgi:hypothetical protein